MAFIGAAAGALLAGTAGATTAGIAAAGLAGAAIGTALDSRGDGAEAAHNAAQAQVIQARIAANLRRDMYNQSREDLAPFRQTGVNALYQLADLYGVARPESVNPNPNSTDFTEPGAQSENAMQSFFTSPGYEWRRQQGIEAIQNANAAQGLLRSGPTLKDLTRFGQGLASEEFGNYTNRLAALAGIGQTANRAGVAANARSGNALADLQTQIGNARASGYIGAANANRADDAQLINALGQGIGFAGLFA